MNIVVLHGWGHNKHYWKALKRPLGRLGKVYIPDLPGFGSEPLINENWGVPDYAKWVEGYVSKKKLKRVVLIGHSFGGRISARFLISAELALAFGLVITRACLSETFAFPSFLPFHPACSINHPAYSFSSRFSA